MAAPLKARVAVSSIGLASAAAEGFRTPPARDTEMIDGVAVVAGAAGAEVVMAGADGAVEAASTAVQDTGRTVALSLTAASVVFAGDAELTAGGPAALPPNVND